MSQDWTVEYYNSSGNWIADTSFYRPNQDVEETRISTQQKIRMADGSNGYVLPEYKYVIEPLSFVWFNTTAAFRTQLSGYINNGTKIRITTHNAEVYTGRFIEYRRTWFTGRTDEFDIMCTFERIS